MRRLFFKIFMWFWLAILVVSATLIASTAVTFSRRAADDRWSQRNGPRVETWAQQVTAEFEHEGRSGVADYVRTFESDQAGGIHSYTFDAENREVMGRVAPAPVMQVLTDTANIPAAAGPQFFPQQRIIADRVAGPSGMEYVMVVSYPLPPLVPGPLFQFLFAPIDEGGIARLLAMLAVAGIFCYWLARYITRPIEKLRLATRTFANGQLETRVDQQVLRRGDELSDLGRDFDRMAERINDLLAAERRLLADVSHTLRSPLARLNVALGLARQHSGPGASEPLNRIEREADLLNRLIGHVLTMARVESGIDLQRKRVFDLSALLEEVAADGDYEAHSRGCGVKFTRPSPCMVDGAPEMLRYAIENVVRNAVRYTAPDTNVEITLATEGRWPSQRAVMQVRDHGPGIPPEELGNLFVRFHRVPNGIRQDSGGTGLGLAITERALRMHEGKVTASNAPGGGLVVTLELPMASTAEAPQGAHAAPIDA